MTSAAELHALQERGDIVWTNARYGSVYAIDRISLVQQLPTTWSWCTSARSTRSPH
jgi:hypothetical protein